MGNYQCGAFMHKSSTLESEVDLQLGVVVSCEMDNYLLYKSSASSSSSSDASNNPPCSVGCYDEALGGYAVNYAYGYHTESTIFKRLQLHRKISTFFGGWPWKTGRRDWRDNTDLAAASGMTNRMGVRLEHMGASLQRTCKKCKNSSHQIELLVKGSLRCHCRVCGQIYGKAVQPDQEWLETYLFQHDE
eukprot:g64090.t1